MTTNPYEPSAAPTLVRDGTVTALNWRAILIAIAICFGVGFVVGVVWGVVAFSLAMAMGPSVALYIDNPVLIAIGFVVGFVPEVFGAIYLGSQLKSRWLTHASLYSFSNFLISTLFMLIPSETGTSWTDIAYCVLLIPVSIACVLFSARLR